MTETILLRSQPHEHKAAHKVTGVELPDGTSFRGFSHESNKVEATLALAWSTDEAERIAEFYQRYLTKPRGEQDSGWNCHSFVAAAMGWNDIRWTDGGFPDYMPNRLLPTSANNLEDHQPYAIRRFGGLILEHSALGLPIPTKNLSVRGFGEELLIGDNTATLKVYGGRFYAQKPPLKGSKLAARMLSTHNEMIPVKTLHEQCHTPQSSLNHSRMVQ